MKKVCMIGPFPPPMNGNSKALDTLARSELFNESFGVYKVNLSGSAIGKSGKFSLGKLSGTLKAAKEAGRLAKEEDIDCFYITCAQSTVGVLRDRTIVRAVLKQRPGAEIVFHLHGGGFRKFYDGCGARMRRVIDKLYGRVDRVIVLSESLVSMYDGIYPAENIRVRYNCVDDEFIPDDAEFARKLEAAKERDTLSVVYLSNMIESKGYTVLYRAAKNLIDRGIKMTVSFAGSFPDDAAGESFVKSVWTDDLIRNVKYFGVVSGEEKKKLLLDADVFVLPTRYPNEGQPISILEAMASGAVIITTDQGGIPDIVKDGENGYVIRNDLQSGVEAALKELYQDVLSGREKLSEIGRRNRAQALERYTEKAYVQGIIDLLS